MFPHFAALISPANVLLFLFPGVLSGFRYYSLFGGRGGQYAEMRTLKASSDDVSALCDKLGAGAEDIWAVGLPQQCFCMVNLQLPLAALDDLGQAVRYALLRHLPFDISRFRVGWTRNFAAEDKHVAVTAWAALRQDVDDALRIVEKLPVAAIFPGLYGLAALHGHDGLHLAGDDQGSEALCMFKGRPVFNHWVASPPAKRDAAAIEVKNLLDNLAPGVDLAYLCTNHGAQEKLATRLGFDDSSAHTLTLSEISWPRELEALPGAMRHGAEKARRKNQMLAWAQVAALAVLLLSLLSIPAAHLVGKAARVRALEREIALIRQAGEQQLLLRDQSESAVLFFHDLKAFLDNQVRMSDVLLEVTLRLPSGTWLTSLNCSDQSLRVQGLADSAAAVIEALENSPRFQDVRLESQVTKSGDKDVFHVVASLEP